MKKSEIEFSEKCFLIKSAMEDVIKEFQLNTTVDEVLEKEPKLIFEITKLVLQETGNLNVQETEADQD